MFQKQNRKKKHMKRLSLITQFKIEFLLPITGSKKVLGKMTVVLMIGLDLSGSVHKKQVKMRNK